MDIDRLDVALANRYRLRQELGRGGMATVYLAEDERHRREVAVKVLRADLAAVVGPERFLNEIRVTASLDHPHIVPLLDSGATDGLLWYVLPYIRGESLRARLAREKQLGVDEALRIARQVANALDFAHQRGVIHRDVKPENILLHEGEAMLADFGIALAVQDAGGNRLTETGISLGSPHYMSPEQATGERQLDARSDIYSLGAVVYEMLTGEPPHTGASVQAVMAKLLTERPTSIRAIRDTVPETVDAAVAKALAKMPADRFPSAGDFARALDTPGRKVERLSGTRRSKLLWSSMTGAAAVAIIAWMLPRAFAPRVVEPERIQLTVTGNAKTPALSSDGRRLAYVANDCGEDGYCTVRVVVQDVGGAGSATIVKGWAAIWRLEWSGDDRYVLVNGLPGSGRPWGLFAVPALGGEPRLLGNVAYEAGRRVGSTDTVLAYRRVVADTVWLHWLTVSDGAVRDSTPLTRHTGESFDAWPLQDGRRLLVIRSAQNDWTAIVMDRDGHARDSLRRQTVFSEPLGPSGDGASLLVVSQRQDVPEVDLVAHRISTSGRVTARVDTILRRVRGTVSTAANGMLLLTTGPIRREVWAMRRDGPASMRFDQRRVAASTSDLSGSISPLGDRILLQRSVPQETRTTSRFSVVPFDGAEETPLSAPSDGFAAFWSGDGKAVYVMRYERDSVRLVEIELTTGRSKPFVTIPAGLIGGAPHFLPGGGLVISIQPSGLLRLRAPGLPDTTFTVPENSFGAVVGVSPDGRDAVRLAMDANNDSMIVSRISLVDGSARRLPAFHGGGSEAAYWLSDGTIVFQIRETTATLAWYRLSAAGGALVRLGMPPRYPADYDMSRDGRHIVANVRDDQTDVYLIRNFATLLGR